MKFRHRLAPVAALAGALTVLGGAIAYAQLEGADRGIAPVDSATTLEVTGVEVDASGKTSEEARFAGWKQAQAKGWKMLWARTTGRPVAQAPSLPEGTLNQIVSGVIIEDEQIGPTRYVARLGILFDRARTGQMLGVAGIIRRSAPMLVVPVMLTGSSYQSFESRNEWQRAWARYRTGGSPIDYVRPSGGGIDPVLLNAAQTDRPGRSWWRLLLAQYGASDVLSPQVHLIRSYPGGPATGTFYARQGPDNRLIGSFTLRAANSSAIPRMVDEGIRRLDALYARALGAGLLAPDPSLRAADTSLIDEIAARLEAASAPTVAAPVAATPIGPAPTGPSVTITLQVGTPTAESVSAAELSVSRIPGVTSAITSSLALGGTSLMRVTYSGDPAALAAALQAQGWSVGGSGTTLAITRPAPAPAGQ